MNSGSVESASRLQWVDVAKGLGILLMFHGHVVQTLAATGNASALVEERLIYSFHMPMFFVIAGFFFRPSPSFWYRLQQLAWRRLAPVLFFGLLLIPLWLVGPIRHGLPLWHEVSPLLAGYMYGMPKLDWVTWFLVCLFICEAMALACLPRIKSLAGRLLFGAACLLGGAALCDHIAAWGAVAGLELHATFIHEAIVALGFYSIGYATFPYLVRLDKSRVAAAGVAILCGVVVLDTFQLNHPYANFAVMMAAKSHGNTLFFAGTALAGAIFILVIGMLVSKLEWLAVIGRNTLPLLGLNGAFFHFFNPMLITQFPPGDAPAAVALFAFAVTVISLLVCAPMVYLLNQYVPQLIGKSQVSGPWLPSLERQLPAGVPTQE
ncbi:MAG: acyltransferase family protein [Betaproteobacteria bacterium]